MALDIFPNLLTASFRGVVFPVAGMSMKVSQTLVEHVYPDRDGGRVEGTGRNPTRYTFRVPMRRCVAEGFYPDGWRALVKACSDRSTGTLVHPELGGLDVKPSDATSQWAAGARDGADVDLEFVESTEDGEVLARLLAQKAPYFVVEEATARAREALLALPDGPGEDLFDLLDAAKARMRQVAGAIDQNRLSISNVLAAFAGFVSAADQIMTSIEKTWDPAAYEGYQALAIAVGAAADQANEIVGKTVTRKRIPKAMTVAGAAAFVAMTLDDFLRFNPALADASEVPAGASVFAQVAA